LFAYLISRWIRSCWRWINMLLWT